MNNLFKANKKGKYHYLYKFLDGEGRIFRIWGEYDSENKEDVYYLAACVKMDNPDIDFGTMIFNKQVVKCSFSTRYFYEREINEMKFISN